MSRSEFQVLWDQQQPEVSLKEAFGGRGGASVGTLRADLARTNGIATRSDGPPVILEENTSSRRFDHPARTTCFPPTMPYRIEGCFGKLDSSAVIYASAYRPDVIDVLGGTVLSGLRGSRSFPFDI